MNGIIRQLEKNWWFKFWKNKRKIQKSRELWKQTILAQVYFKWEYKSFFSKIIILIMVVQNWNVQYKSKILILFIILNKILWKTLKMIRLSSFFIFVVCYFRPSKTRQKRWEWAERQKGGYPHVKDLLTGNLRTFILVWIIW